MKKHFSFGLLCLAATCSFVMCSKDNSVNQNNTNKRVLLSKDNFSDHIVPAEEAKAMMTRYDEFIGKLIENEYRKDNSNYISPNTVVYDIDPLIAYLNYIKERGATKINIRYAAINGDGVNNRINGLPYHSLLLYGSNYIHKTVPNQSLSKTQSISDSSAMSLFFDQGDLCPPGCK